MRKGRRSRARERERENEVEVEKSGTGEDVEGRKKEKQDSQSEREEKKQRQQERAREIIKWWSIYTLTGPGKDSSYATMWTRPDSQYIAPSNEIAYKALFHIQILVVHLVRHRYGFEHRLTPTPLVQSPSHMQQLFCTLSVSLSFSFSFSSSFSFSRGLMYPLEILRFYGIVERSVPSRFPIYAAEIRIPCITCRLLGNILFGNRQNSIVLELLLSIETAVTITITIIEEQNVEECSNIFSFCSMRYNLFKENFRIANIFLISIHVVSFTFGY